MKQIPATGDKAFIKAAYTDLRRRYPFKRTRGDTTNFKYELREAVEV